MEIVAEGIEKEEDKLFAIKLGGDYLLDYSTSEPLLLNNAALYFATQHACDFMLVAGLIEVVK